jgi:uncharacterized membrane protein
MILRLTLAFVGGLPWLSTLRGLPVSLKRAIELSFAASCHHIPERTLVMHAEPMCVCSRCAGIYAGIALAGLGSWSRGTTRSLRILFAVGVALMIADVVTQDLGMHAPWHAARLATGGLVGGAAAAWMLASRPLPSRRSRTLRPLFQSRWRSALR